VPNTWSSIVGYTIGYLRNKSGAANSGTSSGTAGTEVAKHEYQSISDDGDKKKDDDDDFFMTPPDLGPSLVSMAVFIFLNYCFYKKIAVRFVEFSYQKINVCKINYNWSNSKFDTLAIRSFRILHFNITAHIRHHCRKTNVLSCHRCLINTGVEKMSHI